MGDRYRLQPICSACGQDLEEGQKQFLMMAPGESIDLTCPKCGVIWRFWIDVRTNQKEIGQKK